MERDDFNAIKQRRTVQFYSISHFKRLAWIRHVQYFVVSEKLKKEIKTREKLKLGLNFHDLGVCLFGFFFFRNWFPA